MQGRQVTTEKAGNSEVNSIKQQHIVSKYLIAN